MGLRESNFRCKAAQVVSKYVEYAKYIKYIKYMATSLKRHFGPPPPHWAQELNYLPLQGIYQVYGYGYPNMFYMDVSKNDQQTFVDLFIFILRDFSMKFSGISSKCCNFVSF